MNTKHTPAPWVVQDNGIWDVTIKANGGTVCHVNNKGDWFPPIRILPKVNTV